MISKRSSSLNWIKWQKKKSVGKIYREYSITQYLFSEKKKLISKTFSKLIKLIIEEKEYFQKYV